MKQNRRCFKLFSVAVLALVALLSLNVKAQNSLLIDFGPNDVSNGNVTIGPDSNNKYWNNITDNSASAPLVQLVDTGNTATGISLEMVTEFSKNGIKNGGLLAPDNGLLGVFAINTATQDYFFNSSAGIFKLKGLNKNDQYVLSLFGTRNATEKRVTGYVCKGLNTWSGNLQTSGTNLGGTGYHGNNSTIIVSDTILPNSVGEIEINVNLLEGAYAYLACIEVDILESNSNENYFLLNNGFEKVDFSNWVIDSLDQNSKPSIDNTLASEGDNSLRISGSNLSISQQITYHSGDEYFLSANCFIESTSRLTDKQSVYLELSFYNKNDELISKKNSDTLTVDSKADEWRHLLVSDSIPSNTFYVGAKAYWSNPERDTIGSIYLDDFNLGNYTNIVYCKTNDPLALTIMGSSVARGTGASGEYGYANRYRKLLENRAKSDLGYDWTTVNASIGGNNTLDVLGRWDRDLLSKCGRYVMYGLSLGNEGIHGGGQAKFDQFKDNMLLLIDMARENNIEPVIVNNYTRADYNASDYNYIKKMNMLVHSWDVASINVLGAIDNGYGQWADGYENDTWHPNTAGHIEFMYAIVPSLFDALHENKAQPIKVDGTALELTKAMNKQIVFTPEEICHPFTLSFQIKTSDYGLIASIEKGTDLYSWVEIDSTSGVLKYVSSGVGTIMGTKVINDGEWHTVTLTHYYAWGKTFLYSNKIKEGELDEKLIPTTFLLGSKQGMESAFYSNLYFYRSGMTPEEIEALNNGQMLKSSLEIYAPLDADTVFSAQPLVNLAQSTNTIKLKDAIEIPLSLNSNGLHDKNNFSLYPNPVINNATFTYTGNKTSKVVITIYDIIGNEVNKIIEKPIVSGTNTIFWDATDYSNRKLKSGIYIYKIDTGDALFAGNMIVQN